ncbi:MAG TPA: acyltransferase [Polyangiaceae bacterium]|nr:acyltransferase [Polyangiaceae bacterium]
MKTADEVQPIAPTAHLVELNILRGVAILLVLGVHSPGHRGESGRLRPLDGLIHQFGWTGVDLFFVLSGFLIGRLLFAEVQRTQQLDIRRFLLRRMFKIWPGYYLFLLYVVVRMCFASGSLSEAARAWWPAFANIQNFIAVPRDQLWSLAVEEQFYLALPLLLLFLLRKQSDGNTRLQLIPWLSLGLSVVCLALRTVLVLKDPKLDVRAMLSMDALFFGVTLAWASVFRPEVLPRIARHRGLVLSASLLLFLPALVQVRALRVSIAVSCLFLGYGLLLVTFIHRLPQGGLVERFKTTWLARLVASIGTYSYSIYLWHRDTSNSICEFTRDLLRSLRMPGELVWSAQLLTYVVVSILGGVIMGRLVEVPALRLRDRLFPSRAGVAKRASLPVPTAIDATVETPSQPRAAY